MDELKEAINEILQLTLSGNTVKAVDKILAFKGKDTSRFQLMRILISNAQQQNNYAIARTTLDAFERVKGKAPNEPESYYDIANGYQVLFELTIKGNYSKAFECQEVVEHAINYFHKALVYNPRALTNLGNLYDTIGRPIEAIDYYDRAIRLDNNFAMALGNKAYALELLAPVSGYRDSYLIYAYQLYQAALTNDESIKEHGTVNAIEHFRKHSEQIYEFFNKRGKQALLKRAMAHKQYDGEGLSAFVKFYTEYCVKHKLYINLHRSDEAAEASTRDRIVPVLITGMHDDDQYVSDIAFRFNEINESYITARMALVQSQYPSPDFSKVSEQTALIDNLDYSVSNIYVGHLKTAYKEVFGTLDKVAMLINHYLELQLPEENVYYHNLWFEMQPASSTHKPVLSQKIKSQPFLFGLYLLCHELRGSEYSHLRNVLTHRYQRVYRALKGPRGTYLFEDLTRVTIDVFYKVRCAIMYLSLFISGKEQAKHKEAKGQMVNMRLYTNQNLDLWKKV